MPSKSAWLYQEVSGRKKDGTLSKQQQQARQLRAVQGALECLQQDQTCRGSAQIIRLLPKLQVGALLNY
jgi:hypothetical protein